MKSERTEGLNSNFREKEPLRQSVKFSHISWSFEHRGNSADPPAIIREARVRAARGSQARGRGSGGELVRREAAQYEAGMN